MWRLFLDWRSGSGRIAEALQVFDGFLESALANCEPALIIKREAGRVLLAPVNRASAVALCAGLPVLERLESQRSQNDVERKSPYVLVLVHRSPPCELTSGVSAQADGMRQ